MFAANRSFKPFDDGLVDGLGDLDHLLEIPWMINIQQGIDMDIAVSYMAVDYDRNVQAVK